MMSRLTLLALILPVAAVLTAPPCPAQSTAVTCAACHAEQTKKISQSIHQCLKCQECHGGAKEYSVAPDQLPIGATTAVTVSGRYFLPDAEPSVAGATVSNVVVVDEGTITMDVTVKPTQTAGPRTLVVNLFGTAGGPFTGVSGSCPACITLY